ALKVPQRFARSGIQGNEVALSVTSEDESTGRGKYAGPCRRGMLPFPLHFSGVRIDRSQRPGERCGIVIRKIGAAVIGVTRFVGLRRRAEDVALLARSHVKE